VPVESGHRIHTEMLGGSYVQGNYVYAFDYYWGSGINAN